MPPHVKDDAGHRALGTSATLLAALTALVVVAADGLVMGVLLAESPLWVHLLLLGLLAFLAVRLMLEFRLFKPLREVLSQLRRAMRQQTISPPPRIPGGDPLQDIQSGVGQIITVTRQELERMKRLEEFRNEFLGDVSHELKTPLFAIQGFLETLLDGALEDKSVNRKFVKQALKNAKRLNGLVQDLLVISQIETGELKVEREEFRMYEVILDAVDQLEHKLTSKGRSVKIRIEAGGLESQVVEADMRRIRQVVVNLIDNAISYGRPDGTITLRLALHDEKMHVSVEDDGPGITPDHLERIFERFYRIEKSRSREGGGTGLGLSIVKNLVEAHGEEVHAESQPGQGARFWFTLPLATFE